MPCPFCGSGIAKTVGNAGFSGVELMGAGTDRPYVWCGTCGSAGSFEDADAKAIAAWNRRADLAAVPAQVRKKFPVLGSGGASVDLQLVEDHGGQANKNHYQSVARLAERGGLSWSELFAVLHNRPFQKIDTNEAMIACRALEARYLAAIETQPDPRDAVIAQLVEALALAANRLQRCAVDYDTGSHEFIETSEWAQEARAALAAAKGGAA